MLSNQSSGDSYGGVLCEKSVLIECMDSCHPNNVEKNCKHSTFNTFEVWVCVAARQAKVLEFISLLK